MTDEEKKLLLADLVARLPYGVKYKTYLGDVFTLKSITFSKATTKYYIDDNAFSVGQIKPYLRPMSSMDGAEVLEYISLKESIVGSDGITYYFETYESIDWLNRNHFDYRDLIPMGLALAAVGENNPYKEKGG